MNRFSPTRSVKRARWLMSIGSKPTPHWFPLIASGLFLGGSAANLYLQKRCTGYPAGTNGIKSTEVFNIIMIVFAVLLLLYSISPTVFYFIRKATIKV